MDDLKQAAVVAVMACGIVAMGGAASAQAAEPGHTRAAEGGQPADMGSHEHHHAPVESADDYAVEPSGPEGGDAPEPSTTQTTTPMVESGPGSEATDGADGPGDSHMDHGSHDQHAGVVNDGGHAGHGQDHGDAGNGTRLAPERPRELTLGTFALVNALVLLGAAIVRRRVTVRGAHPGRTRNTRQVTIDDRSSESSS